MVYCGSRICGRTLTVIAMAYAIFKTGGKQYRVQTGDVIDVECINTLEEGAEASFDQVLMVENDGKVTVGTPMVEGATVSAKVVSQFRGKKIIAFKFKRRKGFHKKKGSRRAMTKLEITAINASFQPLIFIILWLTSKVKVLSRTVATPAASASALKNSADRK